MAWINIEVRVAQDPPSEKEVKQVLDYRSRKAKARLLADENFPEPAVNLLREMGAKVQTTEAAGLRRHPDENHLAYALRKGLAFVTCDRDFLDERRFPLVHCPAIFVFDFGSGSRQEMKQSFRCLAALFQAPQFYDKWSKVDAKRDCWTELARHLDGSTSRRRMRLWQGKVQEWVD